MPNTSHLEKANLLLDVLIEAQILSDEREKLMFMQAKRIPPVGNSFVLEHLRNLRELLLSEGESDAQTPVEPEFPPNRILPESKNVADLEFPSLEESYRSERPMRCRCNAEARLTSPVL